MENFDFVIVGAGPVGCVIAEQLSSQQNAKVLIIEKRDHIAGNCHDRLHGSGQLIHQYGPHYFRTNSEQLLDYLGRFTEWIPGQYFVKSQFEGKLYPFPINLTTLEMFFGQALDENSARVLLEKEAVPFAQPKNSEEFVLSRVGKKMFEAFYLGYTLKQWERHPRDLDTSVCGRIPIRFNRDERYVDHKYQVTPRAGFTEMFRKMTNSPNIVIMLNTDYRQIKSFLKPKYATVYCGALDEYFDHRLGTLPWRSLRFEFIEKPQEWVQPCVQINYSNDHQYTRTVEIKHVTKQKTDSSVISYEYPTSHGDPYYPVPSADSRVLFEKYRRLAEVESRENNVFFAGRLANYKYYNTDEVIEQALITYKSISERFFNHES